MKISHKFLAAGTAGIMLVGGVVVSPLFLGVSAAVACNAKPGTTPGVPGESVNAAKGWRVPAGTAYTLVDQAQTTVLTTLDQTGKPFSGEIVSPATGTITALSEDGVTITHADGMVSTFAGLTLAPANTGDMAVLGQLLGHSPTTGQVTWTLTKDGTATSASKWLTAQGVTLDGKAPSLVIIDPNKSLDTPSSTTSSGATVTGPDAEPVAQGFALPPAGEPRKASLRNDPQPIPAEMLAHYVSAGAKYGIPWQLLAGIGMEETNHGANTSTSSAGAGGPMQFMPGTWDAYGVDANNDGRKDKNDPADAVHGAANYLVASGVQDGPDGVRKAIRAYNHADWYVNDVLFYANYYGTSTPGQAGSAFTNRTPECRPGKAGKAFDGKAGTPVASGDLKTVLDFAGRQAGKSYSQALAGTDGYWDCSSLVQAAWALAGVDLPRTAEAQRQWLAAGGGTRIPEGQEQPGDLIYWNSYKGPSAAGHVVMVWDPQSHTTIEAQSTKTGVNHFSYDGKSAKKTIFEIYRPNR